VTRCEIVRAGWICCRRHCRLANDGNPATFWQAAAGDTNTWLRVDLEKIVAASQTRLTFPVAGNWRYKIEISDDGETNWKLIADQTRTAGTGVARADAETAIPTRSRFLRVTVIAPAGQVASLAELEATRTLNAQ
jgi:hypothetical protein